MSFERYLPYVREVERFRNAALTPEPTYLRLRARSVSCDEILARLGDEGFEVEATGFGDGVYRVVSERRPIGRSLGHWLGDFFVQQAVTAVAAPALGVRPGERVLDMASAPGGKAIHLSDLMAADGALVLVEKNERRIRALLANVYRTSVPNALVLSGDARRLGGRALFDRVLVDVPCSGEGNLRKRDGRIPEMDDDTRRRLAGLQGELLRRAVGLVRPGGTVLYVTCTFHPWENEGVVSGVLEERGGEVSVESIPLDLPHEPGLRSHEGRSFAPEVEGAWRLYPHHLDSGGLFLCRLKRSGDRPDRSGERTGHRRDGGGEWEEIPVASPGKSGRGSGHGRISPAASGPGDGGGRAGDAEGEAPARADASRCQLEELFGVPGEELGAHHWMVRGDSVWVTTASEWSEALWPDGSGLRLISLGLRATKRDRRGRLRPTTDVLRWLESRIRRGRVALEPAELMRLLRREEVLRPDAPEGFVALDLGGRVLGRGRVAHGAVVHEIPKAQASTLPVNPTVEEPT